MSMLSLESFSSWLASYGDAWRLGDPEAAVKLFTDDAHYYETPFDDPMVGTEAIFQYWTEGAEHSQKDVQFSYQVAAVTGTVGLARWSASFVRVPSGRRVELEGFLEAEFGADGRCSIFREWWHRRESDVGASAP